jgi:membrane-associated phospholipid phosphatase
VTTTAPPRPTAERIWLCYLACVAAVAVITIAWGAPGHDATRFLIVHAVVLVVVLVSRWCAVHRSHDAARAPRVFLGLIGLPVVFSSLCWLLPHAHPEPWEHSFLALDRALFGSDIGHAAAHLPGWLVEVLQICYAGFYGLCIASAVGAGLGRGKAAFDRASLRLVGAFLCSYLGYLLVPTLAPKVVLAFEHDIEGLWLTPALRHAIDAGEANLWDCFPSGHTMLTLTSLLSLWRWNRRWFHWLVLPGALLIVSTVLLRYHWTIDVVAGALLAWPVARACDWLADRDEWPAAPAQITSSRT